MSGCERMKAHLNDFIDGTLGASQARELNTHLEECPACRREYQALKATQELVRAVPVPEGEQARGRVLARFRQSVAQRTQEQRPARALSARRFLYAPLGIATAATALLAIVAVSRQTPSTPEGAADAPVIVATSACTEALPTANDLDRMTSLHAVESFTVLSGNEELQQDALADASSRVKVSSGSAH